MSKLIVKIIKYSITSIYLLSFNAAAVNWTMLQGTHHPMLPKHDFWGFGQITYTKDQSSDLSGLTDLPGTPPSLSAAGNNGKRSAISAIQPHFDSDDNLGFQRLKFGMRGKFDDDSKINYFTLLEVAPNLMTYNPFNKERKRIIALDHASLTFNHIPGARIRVGLFKTPGPEETYQGIHTFDYIQLTDFAAREMIERYSTGYAKPVLSMNSPGRTTNTTYPLGSPPLPPNPSLLSTVDSRFIVGDGANTSYGINAVRDWGIQVFDNFKKDKWDFTYAAMIGRGDAISSTKRRSAKGIEKYLYASAEYDLPGGFVTNKHGIKLYGWYQDGKRSFESDPDQNEYKRVRKGIGIQARGKLAGHRQRLTVEYMQAEGMIFIGPFGSVAQGSPLSGALQYAVEKENKSRGITIDYGFHLNNKWEFDIRYAQHDLLYKRSATVNPGNEQKIKELTFGVVYHIDSKKRITFNYTRRDITAPNSFVSGGNFVATGPSAGIPAGQASVPAAGQATSNLSNILNTVDDRIALQLTWVF